MKVNHEFPARVFISCGQRDDTQERNVAEGTARRLEELGFAPYVAVQEQSLRGIKENIFEQLSSSEYFIFIDFKRERLDVAETTEHRGSLFSHQELAIASYLNLPVLAFQEEGVRMHDGLIGFLQGNCVRFTDRNLLPAVVADTVRQRKWNPNWRNALHVEVSPPDDVHIPYGDARYFLLRVRNLNPHVAARNCYAYLERILSSSPSLDLKPRLNEFKWSGYTFPNVTIGPESSREFDAFYVLHSEPQRPRFSQFSDTNFYAPKVLGPGAFSFHYVVYSDNFAAVRAVAEVLFTNDLDDVSLKLIGPPTE